MVAAAIAFKIVGIRGLILHFGDSSECTSNANKGCLANNTRGGKTIASDIRQCVNRLTSDSIGSIATQAGHTQASTPREYNADSYIIGRRGGEEKEAAEGAWGMLKATAAGSLFSGGSQASKVHGV